MGVQPIKREGGVRARINKGRPRSSAAMHPRTKATLQQLHASPWFSRVGVKDTTKASVLSSWEAAIARCSDIEWENLCLEAANQYRDRLRERAPGVLAKWNDVVAPLRPVVGKLVETWTREVVTRHKLPDDFIAAVRWDILHLCMECEFADVYPPRFFASQAYWYTKGHFPCGWDGDFPDGKLVIY